MKMCILMGSPRENGNTESLLVPFRDELDKLGVTYDMIWLKGKNLNPCVACRTCQKNWSSFGCVWKDDVYDIYERIMDARMIVLASPIYSWYCTGPMKIVLDRLVYGMNKIYGEKMGPQLWKGKKMALITTCGYPPEKGADLWEAGMKRYCKHSGLEYTKMLVERHAGYHIEFMDAEKEAHARQFARELSKIL
ncbi:MAG: flavodoxin family protein [Firmicutes bacterium]|nr:flavodoxin family protein [Bacillota bacterium]